jgi:hypothetical protein
MPTRKSIHFDHPATYKIIVQGKLAQTFSDRLEGMEIWEGRLARNTILTTLEGELSDQAALAGVLNTLYQLHLVVLSVECMDLRGKG